MTSNTQLYLSVGLPVLAILISLLIQLQAVNAFRVSVDKRTDRSDDARMDRFEKRMDRLEDLFLEMRTTFIKDHAERIVAWNPAFSADNAFILSLPLAHAPLFTPRGIPLRTRLARSVLRSGG